MARRSRSLRAVRHAVWPVIAPTLAIGGLVAASAPSPHGARSAADQAWSPFVLVAGLLLVGLVADDDGLFAWLGARLAGLRVQPRALLWLLLALVAAVTAVLNLDTSVVFLTPVLLAAARWRHLGERPFLYGVVFMSNSASLLLPGSNLTNLLVLARERVPGATFVVRMWPAWVAAVV